MDRRPGESRAKRPDGPGLLQMANIRNVEWTIPSDLWSAARLTAVLGDVAAFQAQYPENILPL
jgi:hypothetical protein